MRVAVCLAGQPRSYKICYRNIRSVFEQQDVKVDYHIHTWAGNEGNATPKQKLDRNTVESELRQFYSPKTIEVEESWKNIFFPETWTISRALKSMVKTEDIEKFRYDWVFVGRLDWLRMYGKVNYENVSRKSKILREFWAGLEAIDTMYLEDTSYVRIEDFSYSFNSLTARIWSNIYEDRLNLSKCAKSLEDVGYRYVTGQVNTHQEGFFAIESVLHNISVYRGDDILEPGFPLRTTLADMLGMKIYEPGMREVLMSFMEKYGWYYSKEDIYTYFRGKNILRNNYKRLI